MNRQSAPVHPDTLLPFDPKTAALLLDIDGTILDLAATPREVWVPPSLLRTLKVLHSALSGAVAFVSGRPMADIDLLFSPLMLPTIGGHGAEFRPDTDDDASPAPPPLPRAIKREFAIVTKMGPGVLLEDKGYALALHYRLAPDKGADILAAVEKICERLPDGAVEVLLGKFVVEIKPAGFSKAVGVAAMMEQSAFEGRMPIFIGDDVTDETVFPIIPRYRGVCFSVGRRIDGTNGCFEDPAEVRDWLARAAKAFEPIEGERV
jgi:trehalose 6-phosphate phosphatase